MTARVDKLLARFAEVEGMLGQPDVFSDQKKYRELSQEHSYLLQVKETWELLQESKRQFKENQTLLKTEKDPEFLTVLEEDQTSLQSQIQTLDEKLQNLLIPPDPNDGRNTILELRAGTGGDEAALFVGDCVRMYKMYADRMGWRFEELSSTASEVGGYKEFIMVVSGQNVWRYLKYEGGTHRVQRVPETETQGRVHTSAITVAAMMEPEEDSAVTIDEKELRIDTMRSSGAGGQHVNTTDSAVRITHLPTGVVTQCQQGRSQHKNKEIAMRLLVAKIAEHEAAKKQANLRADRALQVGSGDRSERIRTYNFPQNRVTDHRINLTRYSLEYVMQGDLEEFSLALDTEAHKDKLDR